MDGFRNIQFFGSRDAKLDDRIRENYIDGDLAVIAAKVSGYDDVICRYSVEGYESPNPELISYIEENAEYIPDKYPIVLDIVGGKFTDKQQQTIRNTIEDYFAYELGDAQHETKKAGILFVVTFVLMALSAFIIQKIGATSALWYDYLYIVFWFFADCVIGYILGGELSIRRKRIRAGRLKSMQVMFSDTYDDTPFTKEESDQIVENMISENNT